MNFVFAHSPLALALPLYGNFLKERKSTGQKISGKRDKNNNPNDTWNKNA